MARRCLLCSAVAALAFSSYGLAADPQPAASQSNGFPHKQAAKPATKPQAKDGTPMAIGPAPKSGSMPTGPAPKGKLGTEPASRGKLGTDPKPGDPKDRPPRFK